MTDTVKIPLDTADLPALRYYVRDVMNLDASPNANGNALRSKIQTANPGLTEIEVPAEIVQTAERPVEAQLAVPSSAPMGKRTIPAGRALLHPNHDPKVGIKVLTTADPTKPKEVQVSVNGEVIIMKRGVNVEIPYRHYLALEGALETVAQDTDETSPITYMPIKEWVDQPSYAFSVWKMPSDEEIAEWERRTSALDLADAGA